MSEWLTSKLDVKFLPWQIKIIVEAGWWMKAVWPTREARRTVQAERNVPISSEKPESDKAER